MLHICVLRLVLLLSEDIVGPTWSTFLHQKHLFNGKKRKRKNALLVFINCPTMWHFLSLFLHETVLLSINRMMLNRSNTQLKHTFYSIWNPVNCGLVVHKCEDPCDPCVDTAATEKGRMEGVRPQSLRTQTACQTSQQALQGSFSPSSGGEFHCLLQHQQPGIRDTAGSVGN